MRKVPVARRRPNQDDCGGTKSKVAAEILRLIRQVKHYRKTSHNTANQTAAGAKWLSAGLYGINRHTGQGQKHLGFLRPYT